MLSALHRPHSLGCATSAIKVRTFSSKRFSPKKLNTKYAVQNAQTSVGYLFNISTSTQLITGAIERIKTSNARATHNGDDGADSPKGQGQNSNIDESLDKKKSYPPPRESKGKVHGGEIRGNNQLATLSYLFANGKNDSASENSVTPVRRRIKRKESITDKAGEHVGNDVLRHQNLLRSMRYLFGATIIM